MVLEKKKITNELTNENSFNLAKKQHQAEWSTSTVMQDQRKHRVEDIYWLNKRFSASLPPSFSRCDWLFICRMISSEHKHECVDEKWYFFSIGSYGQQNIPSRIWVWVCLCVSFFLCKACMESERWEIWAQIKWMKENHEWDLCWRKKVDNAGTCLSNNAATGVCINRWFNINKTL